MNDFPHDVTIERPGEYDGPTDEAGQPTEDVPTERVYRGRADVQVSQQAISRSTGMVDKTLDGVMLLPLSLDVMATRPAVDDTVTVNEGPMVALATRYRIEDVDLVDGALGLREA